MVDSFEIAFDDYGIFKSSNVWCIVGPVTFNRRLRDHLTMDSGYCYCLAFCISNYLYTAYRAFPTT